MDNSLIIFYGVDFYGENEEKMLCQIESLFAFSGDEILLIEEEARESLLKKIDENASSATQEEKEKILKRGPLLTKRIVSNLSSGDSNQQISFLLPEYLSSTG